MLLKRRNGDLSIRSMGVDIFRSALAFDEIYQKIAVYVQIFQISLTEILDNPSTPSFGARKYVLSAYEIN